MTSREGPETTAAWCQETTPCQEYATEIRQFHGEACIHDTTYMVFVQFQTVFPPCYDVLRPAFILQVPRCPVLPLVECRWD